MKKLVLFTLFCVLITGVVFAGPDEDLIRAARALDVSLLREALRRDANVNYSTNEQTALMIACEKSWVIGVRILLEDGANTDFANAHGMTALMYAARFNNNLDIVNLLLNSYANVNARDNQNKTVLMYAAENQNDQMVDLLIRHGASLGATNTYNQDALIIAAINNNQTAVAQLLRGTVVNYSQADYNGKTAFIYACENENIQLVRMFLQSGFDVLRANIVDGLPPLLWLIQWKKSYLIIEYLVRNTQAIASRDSNGRDAFWYLDQYDRNNNRLRQLLSDR